MYEMGSILRQCLFGTILCSLSFGVVDAFVRPGYYRSTSAANLHTPCGMSTKQGEWWKSDTAKSQLSEQKRGPSTIPNQEDLIRDISDFGHPRQRASSMGRRRAGPTTAPDTPWKRSTSFPQNDSRISFSWEKNQEKEAPAAAADTASTTKSSSSCDEAVRSSQEAPQKQQPSSVSVSRDTNGQLQQSYASNISRRSNTDTDSDSNNGAPWEAHHRTVTPPRQSPPQAAQQQQQQRRRSMMPPREQLIFDSDSPLETYERQRKESLQRTQGYINRQGYSNNDDIIDTGHYQRTEQGSRYVYDEEDFQQNVVAQPPPSPSTRQRQVEEERKQRVHEATTVEVEPSPSSEAKENRRDIKNNASSSTSNLENELRQLRDEMVEMKEHQESLLKSLIQVQDNLDRAVRMVVEPTTSSSSKNDDKTRTSHNATTTVPSTFFFKDHTTWNNATGEIKSPTTSASSVVDDDNNKNGNSKSTKTLINGISMTQSSLEKVLQEECGVKKFGSVGDEFDPKYHTAMYEISDPSKKPGTIAEVITDGYYRVSTASNGSNKNKKNILRYAEVAVVKDEED